MRHRTQKNDKAYHKKEWKQRRKIRHVTEKTFRNETVNNQTTGRIVINAVDASDRTILTVVERAAKVRSYSNLEFKEELKWRKTMVSIDNELCCCDYCGNIRSTVQKYLRDDVRRSYTC
jgi:hypothetical protein